MKNAVLIAVALGIAICAIPVWSQGGPGGPGGPRPGPAMAVPPPPPVAMLDGLSKLLSLTTDQVASMKTILTASDATLQPLMKTASDAGKALHDAVFAADYEATAVADLTTEALTAQGNVIDASVAVWAQIRAVLTADQFAILAAGPGPGCPPRGGQRPLGQQSGTNRR